MPRVNDSLAVQLQGYRLATAEIIYHMPDHPGLLQSFIWQHYDLAPSFPELKKFLDFWVENIEGKLHSVMVGRTSIITPTSYRQSVGTLQLH